jgi:hypothetical protein
LPWPWGRPPPPRRTFKIAMRHTIPPYPIPLSNLNFK